MTRLKGIVGLKDEINSPLKYHRVYGWGEAVWVLRSQLYRAHLVLQVSIHSPNASQVHLDGHQLTGIQFAPTAARRLKASLDIEHGVGMHMGRPEPC